MAGEVERDTRRAAFTCPCEARRAAGRSRGSAGAVSAKIGEGPAALGNAGDMVTGQRRYFIELPAQRTGWAYGTHLSDTTCPIRRKQMNYVSRDPGDSRYFDPEFWPQISKFGNAKSEKSRMFLCFLPALRA